MRLTRSSLAAATMVAVAAAAQTTVRLAPAAQVSPTPEELAQFFEVFVGDGASRPSAAVVKRILALDANGDTHVSRDELPERMRILIERGDLNGDGVLMAQEVERVVELISASPRTNPPPPLRMKQPATMADVVRDLRLPAPKHDLAMAIVKNDRGGMCLVNNSQDVGLCELHARLRELLDDDEYENFVAAANRLNGRVAF